MNAFGYALFGTRAGTCAIAWGARGIVGVQLPEADPAETRARMGRRFPGCREDTPPRDVVDAAARIAALLGGDRDDLADIALDWREVSDFQRRVYEITRRIPPGQTRTYGELAAELGDKSLARAVGQALGHNPFAPIVPCHRVLAAGGQPGGFSAHGGAMAKVRMLGVEGARTGISGSLFGDFG
jgi:methylated-DNA-[protein]-cysteine S-methyltransferase